MIRNAIQLLLLLLMKGLRWTEGRECILQLMMIVTETRIDRWWTDDFTEVIIN